MELWRDVPGYDDYQVSNYGRVKSLKFGKEKLLIPYVNCHGYLRIDLCKEGKAKHKQIHQLVAVVFLPNPHGYTEVNHKDEDRTNNTVWINEDGSVDLEKSNLEWCTHEYNCNYGTRNQRMAEAMTNGKLSKPVYQYTLDGTLVKIWPSARECGRNGFSKTAVSDCCNNKYLKEGNNKYKGYIWSYVPL